MTYIRVSLCLSYLSIGDFRVFVGDLGNEVTDDVLRQAFQRYPSFQKAKVLRDKKTGKVCEELTTLT